MHSDELRKAKNEAMFREVNERIAHLQETFVLPGQKLTIICECDRADCIEQIDVDVAVYEQLRANPSEFFVFPGHGNPKVEDVVSSHGDYLIVRKHEGQPADIARATDPRS